MQFQFSFKHMKTSEALVEYTQEKLEQKVERYSTKPNGVHITFEVVAHEHHIHCHVSGGDGFNFEVDAVSEDMYASVDLLVDKLDAQLKKHKEKVKRHKFPESLKDLEYEEPDQDPAETAPVDAGDVIKFERAKAAPSLAKKLN